MRLRNGHRTLGPQFLDFRTRKCTVVYPDIIDCGVEETLHRCALCGADVYCSQVSRVRIVEFDFVCLQRTVYVDAQMAFAVRGEHMVPLPDRKRVEGADACTCVAAIFVL